MRRRGLGSGAGAWRRGLLPGLDEELEEGWRGGVRVGTWGWGQAWAIGPPWRGAWPSVDAGPRRRGEGREARSEYGGGLAAKRGSGRGRGGAGARTGIGPASWEGGTQNLAGMWRRGPLGGAMGRGTKLQSWTV
jgi:hypothetical protein